MSDLSLSLPSPTSLWLCFPYPGEEGSGRAALVGTSPPARVSSPHQDIFLLFLRGIEIRERALKDAKHLRTFSSEQIDQDQAGLGSGQPGPVGDVPVHGVGVGIW